MEDNERNELLENGRIHNFLRSGTNRVIEKKENVSYSIVVSKSKLRQRKEVKEQKKFMSVSHQSTFTSEGDESEALYSGSNFNNVVLNKSLSGNGLTSSKDVQTVTGGHISNTSSNHYQNDKFSNLSNSRSNITRSADLCYKSSGDCWKSSTCREEIASGAMMSTPIRARPPLPSHLSHKNMNSSSLSFKRTIDKTYSDDAYNVSSTTYVTSSRTSVFTRIFSTVSHFFSIVYNVLTLKQYRSGIQSTPVRRRAGYLNTLSSFYYLFEFMCYQSACYFLRLDAWILSLFHRSHGHQIIEKKRHSKYLFLLLLPPLIYLGLWWNSTSTSPLAGMSSFTSGVVNLLPSLLVLQKTNASNSDKFTSPTSEDGNLNLLVQKILSSSEFKSILLMQDFRNKEHQLQNDETILSSIKLEQEKLKMEFDHKNMILELALAEQKKILMEHRSINERLNLEYSALMGQIEQLRIQMESLQAHNVHLSRRIEQCRKIYIQTVPKIEIENHVSNFLSGLFDVGDGEVNNPEVIKNWIKTLLVAKDNLEDRLAETLIVVNEKIEEATGKSAETVMASISEMMRQEFLKQDAKMHAGAIKYVSVTEQTISENPCDGCSLSVDKVKEIVNNALHLYDADKTGMVDYALESAGGTVINIRCTENYNERSLALAFLGMTFPWSNNHPRIALQPDVHPGKCWAFRGAQGYLVIRLAKRIKVSAFSIEHIPVSISHAGNIDAAPKNFSVWGLNNETDREPVLLGKYMYQTTAPPLQIFPVQNEEAPPYQIVELAIESNHGNLEYTCLYRFRVHGLVI